MMFSTACAMKTVTDTLHSAFKDIHDEIASMFETKGIVDASERVTNVLAPVEEKIAMNVQQHICDAADDLKRVICSSNIEWINSAGMIKRSKGINRTRYLSVASEPLTSAHQHGFTKQDI